MHCPETLTYSNHLQKCVVECIYPVYTVQETTALYVVLAVLAYIGFFLNYFYCFTGLFRPSMRTYPNSNSFNLSLFGGLSSFSTIWTSLLGFRYVYCDDNVSLATIDNWACVIESIFGYLFRWIFFSWFMFFNISITLRLYKVHFWNAWWIKYIFWTIAIGWNLSIYIIGLSMKYLYYYPGLPGCMLFSETHSWFNFVFIGITFLLISLVTFLCAILSIYKLLQLWRKSNMPFSTMIIHQTRIICLWVHFFVLACLLCVGFLAAVESDYNEADYRESFSKYEICVTKHGEEANCTVDGEILPFGYVMTLYIIIQTFPISTFVFIGLRKTLFLFWVEYFKYCWQSKSIPLRFAPYFDNQIKMATSSSTFG